MGRELKRVDLNFDWKIDKLWHGYINPYRSTECHFCEGSGLNKETFNIQKSWYASENPEYVDLDDGRRYNKNAWVHNLEQDDVNALIEAGRLMDFTHDFVPGEGWKEKSPPYIPTAEEVNEWSRGPGFGHDAVNSWVCVKAKAKRLGVYGDCPRCDDGEIWQTPELKKLHDEWESFEPPSGDGFQLWSTTTEGHPMTPVFRSLEELCEYCEKEKISVFGYNTATKQEWIHMLDDGLVIHKENGIAFI